VLQEILPIWLPYVMMVALAAGATVAMALLRRSRTGIRVLAMKGDETAAVAIGIGRHRPQARAVLRQRRHRGLAGAAHAIFAASLYPDVVFAVDISLVALGCAAHRRRRDGDWTGDRRSSLCRHPRGPAGDRARPPPHHRRAAAARRRAVPARGCRAALRQMFRRRARAPGAAPAVEAGD